jgi:hypothetical protein
MLGSPEIRIQTNKRPGAKFLLWNGALTVGERTGKETDYHRLASPVANLKERNKDGHAHKKASRSINQFMHE